jgi:hypothetical protein
MKLTTEKYIRLLAGSMILISLALSLLVNRWWLLLTAWVGINLIQSVFTGWCLPETIIKKMGVKDEE